MAEATSQSSMPGRATLLRALGLLVLALLCGRAILALVGVVDWGQVVTSLGKVNAGEAAALVGLLLVRQVLNAAPLSLFLRDLSLVRATMSDQATTLVSMVAPPPSDMVLRISIFKSWGIAPSRGLAGATMNTLAFYINRLIVPLLGFLLLLPTRFDTRYGLIALVCTPIGLLLLGAVVLAVRDEKAAARVGAVAGRAVARVRRSVDPAAWSAATVEFRGHVAGQFRRAFPRALPLLLVMVLVDAFILVAALRFVGVPAGLLPALEVVCAFLVMYPLTLTPLQGLGILDAVLVAIMTDIAGLPWEPEIIAGLVVYRIATLGGPLTLGALALVHWRRTAGEAEEAPTG